MKNLLIFLLLLVGCLVAIMSIYMSSISGVMGKMGIVGGDFRHAIDQNELARELLDYPSDVDCGLLQVSKKVPSYLLSKGEDRVLYARELGGERVICGIRHVQRGNIERGVYTIIKGLYYLKGHYEGLRALVEEDGAKCSLLTELQYENWVSGYLIATEGRINDVVREAYGHVLNSKARVAELCH